MKNYDAISPVDGRYRKNCESLAAYFSEASLMRYRVKVEAAYLEALCALPLPELATVPGEIRSQVKSLASDPSNTDINAIKDFESITNHDVKAVEYYLRSLFEKGLGKNAEFIHFGLTSQDINNTAIPLAIRDAINQVMIPSLSELVAKLTEQSETWRFIPMLSHTHGQPASPTALGKEIAVFIDRLHGQISLLKQIPWSAKFGGATGNFNAHYVAYPSVNWEHFGNTFLEGLGLSRSRITTQIDHYDNLAAIFDNLKRINTILLDLSRDMWLYISMNYFVQTVNNDEVGSSAMPHKVNPIDFENAEGNFGIANAIFEHLSIKLPVSRLQRDLSDSTVLRNAGVPFAHTLIAFKSLLRGFSKVKVNTKVVEDDLENNWAVVAEAIQTILRREGYDRPYEALKTLTRTGEKIDKESIYRFIELLDVKDSVKTELKNITPANYVGMAMKFKLSELPSVKKL